MIVDSNVWLSRWPFRRLPHDEPQDLVAHLRNRSVAEAWAASFDGILHRDIGGVNDRLAADCRTHGKGILVPFGAVNPKLPDWQEDLRRCHQDYHMPGIRLHPNYHGYTLADPAFAELLELAARRGLLVQIAVSMEDVRTQHPLVRVPPVDVDPLAAVVRNQPSASVMLLNWGPALRGRPLRALADAGVRFDIATVEGIEGLTRLSELSAERVLFGSNFPLFYFEAALLKLDESGLSEGRKTMLCEENARRILAPGGKTR